MSIFFGILFFIILIGTLIYMIIKGFKTSVPLEYEANQPNHPAKSNVIFDEIVSFDRTKKKKDLAEIGQKVNFWHDHRNGKISIFLKGTDAYYDIIGTSNNSLLEKIYKKENYRNELNVITKITNDSISVHFLITREI